VVAPARPARLYPPTRPPARVRACLTREDRGVQTGQGCRRSQRAAGKDRNARRPARRTSLLAQTQSHLSTSQHPSRRREAARLADLPDEERQPPAPTRSFEQRQRALAKANQIRSQRARLKRELAAGHIELTQVLADPPPCAASAKIRELLLVVPGIGPAKADRALTQCRIAAAKTLAGLSNRQRTELSELLHHR
jgi:hypothetical protein